MSELVEIHGEEFGLGLQIPETKPLTFAPLGDAVSTMTMDEVKGHLSDRKRIVERFPNEKWIINQGQIGSCNGWAGARALSLLRVMEGMEPVWLSGSNLYAQINGGRDMGSMLDDGMNALMRDGVCPRDYQGHTEWQRISPEAAAQMANYKALECHRVDSELELATALLLGFQCVVAVHCNKRFWSMLDSNAILNRANDGPGNHSVSVDDLTLINGRLCFDMANSHGRNYGDGGRAYLTWADHLARTNQYHDFYAIRSATKLDAPTLKE
jgi:hypothetical protein